MNTPMLAAAEKTIAEVAALVEHYTDEPDNLILILHAIQDAHGYVPRESALVLSEKLGIPLARIYEVITFYHYFRTAPAGQHNVVVCHGTSCWLAGSTAVLEAVRRQAAANPQITVSEVRCVGCCALAPLAFADKRICTHLDEEKTQKMLAELGRLQA